MFGFIFAFSLIHLVIVGSSSASSSHSSSFPTTSWLPVFELTTKNSGLIDYTVEVGEPKQTLALRVDVVNPELWLPGANQFTACESQSSTSEDFTTGTSAYDTAIETPCAPSGAFDLNSSISGAYLTENDERVSSEDEAFHIQLYAIDGIATSGYKAEDDFQFPILEPFKNGSLHNNTVSIERIPFIWANESYVQVGSLGLSRTVQSGYNNFLTYFKDNEFIKSNSYSLAPAGTNDSTPLLIAGGLSTSNFQGDMYQFDFIPVQDDSGESILGDTTWSDSLPVIPLSGLGVTSSSGNAVRFSNDFTEQNSSGSYPIPAMLDSRITYNFIPYSTLISLALELNAYYAESLGSWLVECDVASAGTIDFYFGNLTLNIPIDMVLDVQRNEDGSTLTFENGNDACALNFLPSEYLGYSLLGTPFINSVHLAVNNDNRTIALAQPAEDKDLSEEVFYPILSEVIPHATTANSEDFASLTLTINSYLYNADPASKYSQAIISGGEVYVTGASSASSASNASPSGSYSTSSKGDAQRMTSAIAISTLTGFLCLLVQLL
ncbi:hypothetical protein OGAPHI_005045 [Ogataea philodendri]|uniref:Peptidase A1 domain-containing protein n=1 Tax=Ogataea philodendri TaxID=1378263 RepID=A0A9P8P2R9_9ASCO|nr:uncharacterized protein OGAPHI_005045 [Ogataea philodendri]KAH3663644.1 hypothetical protein OGAPHI_005045 [Ogataea philodendri]